ncbi:MAG: pilus assembly protein [Anaerolineales bacterium]|nr:pilus assembly protein [Anaerolineales bacterium]
MSNIRTLAHRLKAGRGQIAVMFALLLPVMLGVVGLVVDGGLAMIQYRRGQVTVDSAALAAATQLNEDGFIADNTVELASADAYFAALQYADENGQGHVAITGVSISGTQVAVFGTITSPTIFMRIFGIGQVRMHVAATSELKYGITEEGQ